MTHLKRQKISLLR